MTTLGIVVIAGWVLDIAALRSVGVGAATMKVNTALCFLLSGLALALSAMRYAPWTIRTLAAVSGAIAVLTTLEFLVGQDIGVDQLFLTDTVTPPDRAPGRMSLITALGFDLASVALLMPRTAARAPIVVVALVGLLVSATALIGYLFGTPVLYQPGPWASIAFHTAVGFLALFLGLLATCADARPVKLITSRDAGGVLARRMLPVLVIVPTLLGWIFASYDPMGAGLDKLELAVFTIAVMVILAAVLWNAAARADALDRERGRTFDALRASDESLRVSEARYRTMVDLIAIGIWIERDGRIVFANPYLAHLIGVDDPNVLIGTPVTDLFAADEEEAAASDGGNAPTGEEHWTQGALRRLRARTGRTVVVELQTIDYPDHEAHQVMALCRDVTAQHEAEAQLRQAQKMEAIGQLTGGVAHDFNNLLTVVIGNLEIALADQERPQPDDPIDFAMRAAERGAALTHRLLAFSRQQQLSPDAIRLNDTIESMADLITRTLGETISVDFRLQDALPPAHADRGQLENVLLNFVINARDAMPDGGKLIVETASVHLDAEYAVRNAEVEPGDYVMLSVSDTGTGMPPEVMERAIDPFFTTKEAGKGTGLGLSMAYGFAKQSRGHLKIYSETGYGTTIRLYLPREDAGRTDMAPPSADPDPATDDGHPGGVNGGETILLVEDDPPVSVIAQKQLLALGYRVLVANNAHQAREILKSDVRIDLLFTDLVMPGGVTGRQLADEAQTIRPGTRILFTSGYTRSAVDNAEPLDAGVHFLPKPYRANDLAQMVREALDGPPRPNAPQTAD